MAENGEAETKTFSPPYNVTWAAFKSTIEKVAAEMPNRVDRSYLSSRSGNEQTYLISAFRGFGLIDENNFVTEVMKAFATDEEGRPARIASFLETHYSLAVELGKSNATADELDAVFKEMFPGITGASRVKAIRFYLQAADYAGIARSPLWKVAKAGTGRRAGRRPGAGGGAAAAQNGTTPIALPKDMKTAYFDLLIKKAEEQDDLDPDLLNRIERLLGVEAPATPEAED